MTDLLAAARGRLFDAAEAAGVPQEMFDQLRHPQETTAVSVPLRRDDGTLDLVRGWRCRYSDILGPTKGGIRFHPSVSGEEVETLAFWMMVKCALLEIPFGGAKGGASVDMRALSPFERERLTRGYAVALSHVFGSARDIPAPDVGTGAAEMAWISETLAGAGEGALPHAVTGKPTVLGGLEGRHGATGDGAFTVLEVLADSLGLDKDARRIAVQGFGSGGRRFATCAARAGWTVVGVADSSGAVYDGDGLDLEQVGRAKDESGKVSAAEGVETLDSDAILGVDCDLLVPAALGGAIDAATVDDLRCRAILEIANGPTLPEADAALAEKGVCVAPDVLVNGGGVLVSWMEWVHGRSQTPYPPEKVAEELKSRLTDRACAVRDASEELGLSLRGGAYALAARRLAEAVQARGGDVYASARADAA